MTVVMVTYTATGRYSADADDTRLISGFCVYVKVQKTPHLTLTHIYRFRFRMRESICGATHNAETRDVARLKGLSVVEMQ